MAKKEQLPKVVRVQFSHGCDRDRQENPNRGKEKMLEGRGTGRDAPLSDRITDRIDEKAIQRKIHRKEDYDKKWRNGRPFF